MIAGIIVALIGAAAIIVALMATSLGLPQENAKQVKKIGWILGILLILAGGAWIGVSVYRKGASTTRDLVTAQTAYQIAQNEGNPEVIAANSQAYQSCYNNCIRNSTYLQRTVYRKRTDARCQENCK